MSNVQHLAQTHRYTLATHERYILVHKWLEEAASLAQLASSLHDDSSRKLAAERVTEYMERVSDLIRVDVFEGYR